MSPLGHIVGSEPGQLVIRLVTGWPASIGRARFGRITAAGVGLVAFAFRSIQDRLDGMVDLGTQSSSDTRFTAQPSATPAAAPSSTQACVAGESRRAGQAPEPAAVAASAVAVDQVLPVASAGEVQAAGGGGQAAQVAAQAYPISTKEAVAAAGEKAEAGQGAGTGPAPAGARSMPSRPGPQQTREEPRGR